MGSASRIFVSAVGLAAAVSAGSAHAAVARDVSPDGAVYTFASGPSGEMVMTVDAGDLHGEKSVKSDGSSVLFLRAGNDELRLELNEARVTVTDRHGSVSFVPDSGDERGETAVRVALARSRAVQQFRALAGQAAKRGTKTAFEQGLALSGAVIAQVGGEPDALRGFAKRHRVPGPPARLARASFSDKRLHRVRIVDCWGEYERFINWAFTQYQMCLTDAGNLWRIHSVTYCEIQYVMRAESAWFQFLACSTIPLI